MEQYFMVSLKTYPKPYSRIDFDIPDYVEKQFMLQYQYKLKEYMYDLYASYGGNNNKEVTLLLSEQELLFLINDIIIIMLDNWCNINPPAPKRTFGNENLDWHAFFNVTIMQR